MPVTPIIFRTTQAGRDAAANAINNLPNGKLSLTTVKIGSGKYTPTGNETALQNPYANEFSIGGGGVQAGSGQIRFTPIMNSTARIEVFEIGLFGDAASGNVLFAIASTPSASVPLCVIEANIETIFSMNVGFEDIDAGNIDLVVDVNAPLALSLMGTHLAAAHPHSQYKRTNDNSERLKVADAVDADEAVSKAQLDALASSSGGSSSNLQAQIDAEEAARIAADNNLQGQINGKADLAGNAAQIFNVANAFNGTHAVNLMQLLTGFVSDGGGFDLPDFLGGWEFRFGETTYNQTEGNFAVTFNRPFTDVNSCLYANAIYHNFASVVSEDIWFQLVSKNESGATFFLQSPSVLPSGTRKASWFAIGKRDV